MPVKASDFKSGVSTYFTIRANCLSVQMGEQGFRITVVENRADDVTVWVHDVPMTILILCRGVHLSQCRTLQCLPGGQTWLPWKSLRFP